MSEIDRIRWPEWETFRRIGRGSFGTVYEIRRDLYGDMEKCALKVITIPHSEDEVDYLRCSGLDDASITKTFHRQVGDIAKEYKLMAQLRENPNIVRCDDFRDIPHEDGLGWDIYIKMELLTPIMKCLDRLTTEEQIVHMAMDICNALIDCQEKNIIHRDIKPQNVFVSESGRFKLGDFGIARTIERTTHATAGIGTYSYMAPEIAKDEPYGQSVDIYSLGLMMYWLLNERRGPFMPLPPVVPEYADEEQARRKRFAGEPLPAPSHGSSALKQIVLKACAYAPKDRYQSAAAMLDDLNNMDQETVATAFIVTPNIDVEQKQENDKTAKLFIPDTSALQDSTDTGNPFSDRTTDDESPKINGLHVKTESALISECASIAPTPIVQSYSEKNEAKEITSDQQDSIPISLTNSKNAKNKKGLISIALACLSLAVLLCLFFSMWNKVDSRNSSATKDHDATQNTTETSKQQSAITQEQLTWSAWSDSLPEFVSTEDYDIEEQILYRSKNLETTSSDTENTMAGWELYDTKETVDGFGEWSDWSPTKIDSSASREVETRIMYRYRDKETTTGSSSIKDGWTLYDTTYFWGDYGSWSNWSTSAVSSSESRKTESKTQYRYRDITYSTEYTSWSSWSDWQLDAVSEDDCTKVETREAYRWYCYYCSSCGAPMPYTSGASYSECYTSLGGCGKSGSAYQTSGWDTIYVSTAPSDGTWAIYNKRYIVANGQKWFISSGESAVLQYRYATRSTQQVTNYGSWSSWVDATYSASSTREVQTRTVYRYCDRPQIATYHFFRWKSWSNWSETAVNTNNNRQVETTTHYRYRDEVKKTTYYFQRWSDWSDYSTTIAVPSDTVEVETKTQYRYKSK